MKVQMDEEVFYKPYAFLIDSNNFAIIDLNEIVTKYYRIQNKQKTLVFIFYCTHISLIWHQLENLNFTKHDQIRT